MKSVIVTCLLLVAVACVLAAPTTLVGRYKFPSLLYANRPVSRDGKQAEYEVNYYNQTLDHFNFETKPETYQQRYLLSRKNWAGVDSNGTCLGPIFFYTGNEGDIELFWDNTGLVHTLAQKFGALEFFAEHRYYGKSLPFGAQSFTKQNVGYLSSEQALADFAQIITAVKKQLGAESCPVIAFGGSYGGMLTAWMRLKYPNIVDGGIAASAPIFQFRGTGVSQWSYNEIIANDFAKAGPGCDDAYRKALFMVNSISATQTGLDYLSNKFRLCKPLNGTQDAATFLGWLEGGIAYQAMADYPYPANFLMPMPGWPINASCKLILNSPSNNMLDGFFDALSVYYNYTGAATCFDINEQSTPSLGNRAWDYQACTEMVFPISSNGTSDLFPPSFFDLATLEQYCQSQWGVTPRPDWIPTHYAQNPEKFGSSASNIVFSNGLLDPWRSGGVQESISESLVAVIIEDGAHHLDLRAPNPLDPKSVIQARQIEIQHIQKWISQATKNAKKVL